MKLVQGSAHASGGNVSKADRTGQCVRGAELHIPGFEVRTLTDATAAARRSSGVLQVLANMILPGSMPAATT